MKKHYFLSLAAIALSATASANVIDMGGASARLDTVESYQVGPGTVYSHIQMTKGSKVRQVYLLDVDLSHPNVTLETVLAHDKLATTETLSNMYQRKDAAGHRMVGGINANFWCVGQTVDAAPAEYDGQLYMPLQGCMSDGMIATDVSSWDRDSRRADGDAKDIGYFVLTRDKKGIVRDMRSVATVTVNGNSMSIRDINRKRTYAQEDRLTLYNKHCGTTLSGKCGKEVVFDVTGEWTVNQDMTCTVTGINTKGGTVLTGNQGALQGFQAGSTFLETLKVGDTFTLSIALTDRETSQPYDVYQMVSGNALVMVDGELTQRNYNEQYNSQDYPRPIIATNATNDRVWLLECAPSGGLSTAEGCYILRSMGASNAGSYDGGGSAQMNIFGQNMFKTTESTPRPIILGLWVVSTAPDTNIPGQLQFVNPLTAVPAYASYTPTLRAWTAEGLLLSHDYKDYTLSCEPATLGTISADGKTFTANPVTENGKLIAVAGTGRAETPIEIRNGAVRIVLDSVVLGNRDYKVDVQAVAGDFTLPLDAKALDWLSTDDSRCVVNEEGVLHAVANGRTQVVGSLASFTDTLDVITEMANSPQRSVLDGQVWTMDTTFSSVRNVTMVMPLNLRLWGNPDTILVVVNTNATVQSLELAYQENRKYKMAGTATPNVDYAFVFPTDKLFDKLDQSVYPIVLESAKFTLKDPKKSTRYTLTIKDIILCYRDWSAATSDPMLVLQSQVNGQKFMVNGQTYIISNGIIYDMQGNIVEK